MAINKLPLESQAPKRRLVHVLFLVIWASRLVSGLFDVAERHVPAYPEAIKGSPDIGQFAFYVAIPAVLVAFNLLMLVFAKKLPRWVSFVFTALQIITLLIILFLGGGGV
ncbi:MAG TPA: hypothetical protein VF774_08830 [Pseudoduganella sp.]|jgi:cytochrome b561